MVGGNQAEPVRHLDFNEIKGLRNFVILKNISLVVQGNQAKLVFEAWIYTKWDLSYIMG